MRNTKTNDRHNEITNKIRTHFNSGRRVFSSLSVLCYTCYYMVLDILNLLLNILLRVSGLELQTYFVFSLAHSLSVSIKQQCLKALNDSTFYVSISMCLFVFMYNKVLSIECERNRRLIYHTKKWLDIVCSVIVYIYITNMRTLSSLSS